MRRISLFTWFFAAWIGVLLALHHARVSWPLCAEYCTGAHNAILDGTIGSPIVYRVFSPTLVNLLIGGARDVATVSRAYIAIHFVAFPLMAIAMLAWFRRWLSEAWALVGVVFVGALTYVLLLAWATGLYNAVEIVVLCPALLLIAQRRGFPVLCALTVIGTLNRETAVLIPLAYAAFNLPDWRRDWRRASFLLALWGVVFVGLRLVIGWRPDDTPVVTAWAINTGREMGNWWTVDAALNNLPFLPLWLGAILNIRRVPASLQRLAVVALVYAGLFLVFALWREVRLLLPLVVLLTPIALWEVKSHAEQ